MEDTKKDRSRIEDTVVDSMVALDFNGCRRVKGVDICWQVVGDSSQLLINRY